MTRGRPPLDPADRAPYRRTPHPGGAHHPPPAEVLARIDAIVTAMHDPAIRGRQLAVIERRLGIPVGSIRLARCGRLRVVPRNRGDVDRLAEWEERVRGWGIPRPMLLDCPWHPSAGVMCAHCDDVSRVVAQ